MMKRRTRKKILLSFTRELIQQFKRTCGVKRVPDNVRKMAQELLFQSNGTSTNYQDWLHDLKRV